MLTSRDVQLALRQLFGNVSAQDIADETGVDRATIYRIMGAKTYCPRFEIISALVDALGGGITVSQFLAKYETSQGLQSKADAVTSVPSINQIGSDGSAHVPPAPAPLDVGTVIAGNTAAIVQLSRTIDRFLATGMRAPRKQAPASGPRKPRGTVRTRKTG